MQVAELLTALDQMSPYVGERTLRWLKVKQPRYERARAAGTLGTNRRPVALLLPTLDPAGVRV